MSLKERAHKHAENALTTRKLSEPFDAPWPAEDGAVQDQLAVRELGADARIGLMSEMEVDAKSMKGSINLRTVLPYVTDLIVDPATSKPAFGLEDHDWLVETYPALVEKAVMTAILLSDLGDTALEATVGNSETTPN